jgi:sialidase-1
LLGLETIRDMNYLRFRAFLIFFTAVFAVVTSAYPSNRPNVLFIAIDDLRPDLGCYGDSLIISPHIDQLARGGALFNHAYCQQSDCNPSRASVLTGLRPDATQVHGNHTHYREAHPTIVTLSQHFKNHGYHTQAFGEIYHGVFPEGASKTVADTFDDPESWSVPSFRPEPRYYYTEEGIEQSRAAYQKMYQPKNPEPTDWTNKLVFGPMTEAPDVADEILYDGMVAQRAIRQMKILAHNKEQPFFLAIGFIKPHSPFVAPKKYWDLYDPTKIELAANNSIPSGVPSLALHGSGEMRRYTDQLRRGKIPDLNQRQMKHGYAACISYVDAQVGKVLGALDELGLRDDTIVVLWSDQGYHLGEKGLSGKTTNFELDSRVAMILSAAGKEGNGISTEALVELVDLYPTLSDLAGLQAPKHNQLQLGRPFGDHMVLQRGKRVPVWGTAHPGKKISVTFSSQKKSTTTNAEGQWSVTLESLQADEFGGKLTITDGSNSLSIEDVVVGEVWLCAGQSNMRWMLKQSLDAKEAIAAADNPNVRLLDFTSEFYPTKNRYSLGFLRSVGADNYYATKGWQRCSPDTVASFSAVAYYFGAMLQEQLGVPVGLIHNAVGGVPMESYIPTFDSTNWWDDSDLPAWCRERGRNNLAAWLEKPVAPAPHHPFEPGFLYEAGMRPLEGVALQGFIWYQGESNATAGGAGSLALDPAVNKAKFLSLIENWREAWGNQSLPFYFVQLPGLNRNWSLFREMQLQVSRELPFCGMAVSIDIGHPTNVHPTNKRPVGERLARLALDKTYGMGVVGTSPVLVNASRSGNAMKLVFSASLTTADGRKPTGFVVADRDKEFHPAVAMIKGKEVQVSSEAVVSPLAVRYAWENDPKSNLIGTSHLPVSPFRTDSWLIQETNAVAHNLDTNVQYTTSFEDLEVESVTRLRLGSAIWTAEPGHAQITRRFAHRGNQSLHLLGGLNRNVTVVFEEPVAAGTILAFQAERWTSRSPYEFRVEAKQGNTWQEIYHGDEEIKVGRPFLSTVDCPISEKTTGLKFISTAPANTGTLLDDVIIRMPTPMEIGHVSVTQQVNPILIGKKDNPVIGFNVDTTGSLKPKALRNVTLKTEGTSDLTEVAAIRVFHDKTLFGETSDIGDIVTISGNQVLADGENMFRVFIELKPNANQDHLMNAGLVSVGIEGTVHKPEESVLTGAQRVGLALRTAGQDDCHTYRIPGLATTQQGTLIAVYDNRYRSGGDLPGDIDVGMSRSIDGGRSWKPMKVIMDMGNDPAWSYDGIGDPSILVDRETGRIWVTATWSHGDRSWNGSGPGMEPEETGQFMLVHSDDDGLTWSEPTNITQQIKKPEWRFVLQGPGKGITMRDGTLVFPAQFRSENVAPVNGKPFSTMIYSRDRGETWAIGTGVKIDTTEAQLVELDDGSIMINCRDNRNRGLPDSQNGRTVAVTKDLGKTWDLHPTDRKALAEPTCMASLIRFDHKQHGPLLVFSNPATGQGRFNMTLKVSNDEGMTWPEKWHTVYDARRGAGYSCMTQIDDEHIGVLYEGVSELYFVRFTIAELLKSAGTK